MEGRTSTASSSCGYGSWKGFSGSEIGSRISVAGAMWLMIGSAPSVRTSFSISVLLAWSALAKDLSAIISSGANTAGSSIAARQKARVAISSTTPSTTKPPPITLTDSLDARSSPIVTVAILSRTHAESVSPCQENRLFSGSQKIGDMSSYRHYFDEETIMTFNALYLFMSISGVFICQERLD